LDHNIVFKKNANIFDENTQAKIAANCDHSIDPWFLMTCTSFKLFFFLHGSV
jgi:hypothetical protein